MDNVREFWEKCNTTFAHITTEDWLKDKKSLFNLYSNKIKEFKINPANKRIIDYGIGGGHLGMYLLENFKIKRYIGLDIAERSLDSARKNLNDYSNCEFHLTPVNFKDFNADLFISLAVIQHFPDKEYLDSFLKNLNNSTISELFIQIRHAEVTSFSSSYSTHEEVRLGCHTNSEYLLNILNNYEIIKFSQVYEESKYQYLQFKKIIK